MGIYRYPDSSVIQEVSVIGKAKKPWAAYLFAGENADADQLGAIKSTLTQKGWQAVPVTVEGKAALAITKFGAKEDLLSLLRNEKLVEGTAKYSLSPNEIAKQEKDKKKGAFGRALSHLREKSLHYTGLFYLLGAVGLTTSGLISKRYKEAVGGILYGLTDPLLMVYGHPSTKQQLGRVSERLIHHLHAQGMELPKGSGLHYDAQHLKSGTLHGLNNFFSDYPAQIACALNGAAAFQMFRSGKDTLNTQPEILKHKAELERQARIANTKVTYDPITHPYTGTLSPAPMTLAKKGMKELFTNPGEAKKSFSAAGEMFKTVTLPGPEGNKVYSKYTAQLYDMLGGFANATAAFSSMIIPEKKDATKKIEQEKQHKRHGLGGIWDWIREKPLRLVGYVYSLVTLAYFKAAFDEMRSNKAEMQLDSTMKKNWAPHFKFGTGGFYLTADLLLAISSKDAEHRANLGVDGTRALAAKVAQVVVAQQSEKQEATIQSIAGFLAAQPEVNTTAEALTTVIREQTDAIRNNPWAGAKKEAPALSAPEEEALVSEPHQRPPRPAERIKPSKGWKAQLEPEPIAASPQLGG